MDHYTRDTLIFDVVDTGPADGPAVILLHGWPSGAACWDEMSPRLAADGLRTLAPDQRGYSPRARPTGRKSYVMPELVADALALADAASLDRFHLVGHDWGGAVAWSLAAGHPERVASLTVLSTPHPRAMQQALKGTQALRSSYMVLFQIPRLPEALLLARHGGAGRRVLRHSGLSATRAAAYMRRQSERGALTASLAWYRALPVTPAEGRTTGPITVPTRYVWSDGDTALGRRAAELTAGHVTGPYRFDALRGVSHWIPEEVPDVVAATVAEQVAAHP